MLHLAQQRKPVEILCATVFQLPGLQRELLIRSA
jgi:hypothetical protein